MNGLGETRVVLLKDIEWNGQRGLILLLALRIIFNLSLCFSYIFFTIRLVNFTGPYQGASLGEEQEVIWAAF